MQLCVCVGVVVTVAVYEQTNISGEENTSLNESVTPPAWRSSKSLSVPAFLRPPYSTLPPTRPSTRPSTLFPPCHRNTFSPLLFFLRVWCTACRDPKLIISPHVPLYRQVQTCRCAVRCPAGRKVSGWMAGELLLLWSTDNTCGIGSQ